MRPALGLVVALLAGAALGLLYDALVQFYDAIDLIEEADL